MKKLILPFMWIAAAVSVVFLTSFLKGETQHFFGIADNREQVISFSYPVRIEKIDVIEGESVNSGELILHVSKRDISTQKAIIKQQIKEVKSRYNEEIAADNAELKSLKAQKQAAIAELDAKIRKLQSQNSLNLKLLNEITDNTTQHQIEQASPLLSEINALIRQKNHTAKSLQTQIDAITLRLNRTKDRPVDARVSELTERKVELEKQETDLIVKTDISGRVGSINYKEKEQIAPFQPILTIHSNMPKSIKGYIHEDVQNKVKIGQTVWITSKSSSDEEIYYNGQVESLGNRVVEYPQRLRKNPLVLAWGREVVIELSGSNNFLSGEKVIVLLSKPEKLSTKISQWLPRGFRQDTPDTDTEEKISSSISDNKNLTSTKAPASYTK
ncbi:MAG: Unknown protein [uncultured Thiotrichaceae bacterium]|uniref:HlyD family secretion protein n=1 Tax=uncultured Thiotrichaceae bacterium TaxID=298394 RepID=A0A6S6TZ75_9GAMM|nr:MAG: Unknown protein [uncultured Thiotrichaceae bacterium]